jgi:hypothetical protein
LPLVDGRKLTHVANEDELETTERCGLVRAGELAKLVEQGKCGAIDHADLIDDESPRGADLWGDLVNPPPFGRNAPRRELTVSRASPRMNRPTTDVGRGDSRRRRDGSLPRSQGASDRFVEREALAGAGDAREKHTRAGVDPRDRG